VARKPGEAVGAICQLAHKDGRNLTINVEYNQLEPLLKATINPKGDAADATGFSPFPGNTNVLIFAIQPYAEVLKATSGAIPEFVNPKYKVGRPRALDGRTSRGAQRRRRAGRDQDDVPEADASRVHDAGLPQAAR
jgi:hypothetical protein